MKKKRYAGLPALLTAAALLLTACGGATSNDTKDTGADAAGTETTVSVDPGVTVVDGSAEATVLEADGSGYEFSGRDLDPSYDEAAATVILSDDGVTVDGSGVTVDGADVTITAAGTYLITGTLSEGSITVAAGEEDKVQLVLSGVSVHNSDGPALYVRSGDKVFLTLADGTDNALTDGSGYTVTDGDTELDAAVFSRSDLTINGGGSLTVTGSNKHGVVSKDDLVVVGCDLIVTAQNAALSGKDCVKIAEASLNLTAGTDGIRSDNDEDAECGYVYIHSGDITVRSDSDGIQAVTALFVAGGSLTVDATDDCLSCDGSITITGGVLKLTSGDDGVHADGTLTVDGGEITVTAAEGLEATVITINDGVIDITASDDGINAAQKSTAYTPLVEINGGTITIVMGAGDTDGVDSNGSIIINGGTLNVTGSSTFDYDGSGVINGGTVIVNGQQVNTLPNQMMGGMGEMGGAMGGFGGGPGGMIGGPGMGGRP